MRAASFVHTGNIEIVHEGQRVLLGQYADGQLILNREQVVRIGAPAYRRIDLCSGIVEEFGKPKPALIWN